jgi:secondary thiamine-phosphate synthase enzyme
VDLLHVDTDVLHQVVDLTPEIEKLVVGRGNGLCSIFMKHTTAALTLAALEPGAAADLIGVLEHLLPAYAYEHLPADHAPAHVQAALIGASLVIPVSHGEVNLGTFQRIVLVELQGPRNREVEVRFISAG